MLNNDKKKLQEQIFRGKNGAVENLQQKIEHLKFHDKTLVGEGGMGGQEFLWHLALIAAAFKWPRC